MFNVVGRQKKYDALTDSNYGFSDGEKDNWANLFEYRGSHDSVHLRFSVDRLGLGLDDISIVFGDNPGTAQSDAWEDFIASLQVEKTDTSAIEIVETQDIAGQPSRPAAGPAPQKNNRRPVVGLTAACLLLLIFAGGWLIWNNISPQPDAPSPEDSTGDLFLYEKPSIAVLPF